MLPNRLPSSHPFFVVWIVLIHDCSLFYVLACIGDALTSNPTARHPSVRVLAVLEPISDESVKSSAQHQ